MWGANVHEEGPAPEAITRSPPLTSLWSKCTIGFQWTQAHIFYLLSEKIPIGDFVT